VEVEEANKIDFQSQTTTHRPKFYDYLYIFFFNS